MGPVHVPPWWPCPVQDTLQRALLPALFSLLGPASQLPVRVAALAALGDLKRRRGARDAVLRGQLEAVFDDVLDEGPQVQILA
jgi:hypothetical protein